MKYIVTYQYFTEYNQFEGSWDTQKEKFSSLSAARKWIKAEKKNNNIKQIELSRKIKI